MLRVAIIESQSPIREALATYLGQQAGIHVVATAGRATAGGMQQASEQADVILVDASLMHLRQPALFQRWCRQFPEASIILMTTLESSEEVVAALQAGASGAMRKESPLAQFRDLMYALAKGQAMISAELARAMARRLQAHPGRRDMSTQMRLLQAMGDGLNPSEIEGAVGLSPQEADGLLRQALLTLQGLP